MMTDELRKVATEQYGKLEYPVTHEELYCAGFEAGAKYVHDRSKWHKVADGDLPKIDKPCLVYLVNDCVITARLREDNVWTTNGRNAFENVIAWCEIPKFE